MTENTKTLYQLYLHQTRIDGNSPAFFAPEKTFTYAEFLEMVDAVAAGLLEKGVAKGDRVCTLALNTVAHFSVIISCAKIGAIAYPINWRLSPEEIKKIIELAEPRIVFVEKPFLNLVEKIDASVLGTSVLMGEGTEEGYISFDDLRSTNISNALELGSSDPGLIISTAAVAGYPRGGVLSHGNMEASIDMVADIFQLTKKDRYLANLPFFHITGIQIMFGMAAVGGACVVPSKFEPELETRWIDKYEVSIMFTFPPMLEGLIGAKEKLGSHWNSLKICLGILNPPEIVKKFIGMGVGEYWTAYGQTETSGAVTLINVAEKPGSIGKPLPVNEVRLVDEDNNDVQTGEVGEIVVKGPLVFTGYWRDDPATQFASRFGWHHTGDLAKADSEGYLYYAGRKPEKDLIKSGGENIYPAELEYIIESIPSVAAACVFGIPDEEWGETVKAIIELKTDGSMTIDDILEAMEGKIASYKKPRVIDFVEIMPRLATGQIDRESVKSEYSK